MKLSKRILALVATATAMISALCTPLAMAASSNVHPYPRMVALGDSITFGYNLDPRNYHASREAYPFLIGKDLHFQVRDLAEPGWTTGDLLHALQTNHYMQESVKHADVVTIDIGSNDILGIAEKDGLLSADNLNPKVSATELKQFAAAIGELGPNLINVIDMVKSLSPTASIVLYNLYDPIPSAAVVLHTVAEPLIASENAVITQVAKLYGLPVADAHTVFNGKQTIYVRLGDVHPTIQGQEALAAVGETALKQTSFGQSQE